MIKRLEIFLYTVVLALSMILLIYIGYADSFKAYTKVRLDEISSISKMPQYKINSFLHSENQLKHFIGFRAITNSILDAKESILSMKVLDLQNRVIFENSNFTKHQEHLFDEDFLEDFFEIESSKEYLSSESEYYYKLNLSLYNKFEPVGTLEILVDKKIILKDIQYLFKSAIFVLCIILLVYIIIISSTINRWKNWKKNLAIIYSVSYLALATFTTYSLIELYTDAIKGKSEALISTLAQRIEGGIKLDGNLALFSGINDLINSYTKENPDIAYIKLKSNNDTLFQTLSRSKNSLDLNLNVDDENSFVINYGIDKDLIYQRLWKNIKNFLVLFVASTIIAYIFLNLAIAFKKRADVKRKSVDNDGGNFSLELAKPLFFLTIFVEGLMVSFLPKYFEGILLSNNLDINLTSTIFTIYFFMYAMVLIPSSKYIGKYGVKKFLIVGSLLFTASIFTMIFVENFYLLCLVRAVAGIGQGMVFSGIQSYILDNSSAKEKTKGTSIIVYGYNAGMLSGTAIGALLVKSIAPEGVFVIYFLLSLFLIAYIFLFIKDSEKQSNQNYIGFFEIFKNIKYVFKDVNFIKGIALVGIPTKIVLGGIMIFAMPLLLTKENYANDDIGQMLIFYSLGVLGSAIVSAKIADKNQNSKLVLNIGTFVSAVGLLIIGSYEFYENELVKTAFIISGIFILGIAHGFIHAPIVSYITETKCTKEIGVFTTVAIYRFVERMGHAIGPLVLSTILMFTQQSMLAIQLTGVVILIFGFLFSIKDR